MADQHRQVLVGHVGDVNMDTELSQDPPEVTMEGEEEAMGEMENNRHPRPQVNAAAIAQNAGLSPPVQPKNDMMLFMRQLMAQMKMSSEAMSRKKRTKTTEKWMKTTELESQGQHVEPFLLYRLFRTYYWAFNVSV